jgi:transposase
MATSDPMVMALVGPLLAVLATMLEQFANLTKRVLNIAKDEPVCRQLNERTGGGTDHSACLPRNN